MKGDIVDTVKAIALLFCVMYTARGLFFWAVERCFCKGLSGAFLVIRAKGDGEHAEQELIAAQAMCMTGKLKVKNTLVYDVGLTPEGKRFCRLLCKGEDFGDFAETDTELCELLKK